MEPRPAALYPLILLISSTLATDIGAIDMYMDSYGTCQQSSFFEVHDEGYLVHAKGSGQPYQTMRCSLRFRAARDQQLCVKFNNFVIDDCSVNFKVFQESQPIDFARQPKEECLFRHYSCQDSPQIVCSTDRYLTLQLYKERIDAQGYSLLLQVVPKTMKNEIIMSLWMIVGVILGVVIVIVVLAVVIVLCCRKDKHHGRVLKKKNSKPRSGAQGRLLETGPEPSAPPLDSDVEMHHHILNSYGQFPNEPPPPYQPKPEPV